MYKCYKKCKGLSEENYNILMKQIREEPNEWRQFMYIDRNTQYCQDVCNHNDDTTQLFSGYGQTDSHGKSEDQNINNFRGAEQI